MGLRGVFIAIVFLFTFQTFWTQDSTNTQFVEHNKSYKKYPNKITVRIDYTNTSNALELRQKNSDLFVRLTPNKQEKIGGSIAFRHIQIGGSFAPDFLSKNKDNANSKLFNINAVGYIGKHWMQTLRVYGEKGFYLTDGTLSEYFPNVKSFKIGGGTSYIFNENFSFRSIISQNEKQLISTSSFIPRIVYYYSRYRFNLDQPDITTLYSFDVAFAPSYYYNFVPTKNLMISLGASVGVGANITNSATESLTSILTEFDFGGSIVYDIENLYVGAHFNYVVLNHNSKRQSYVKDDIPYLNIFMGYRLKSFKSFLKNDKS